MIPCQRDKFTIPDEIAYLNCAFTSPLLKTAAQAGEAALQVKKSPWKYTVNDFFETTEQARSSFAALVNCSPEGVAITPSASYGVAVAARNIPIEKGRYIIGLDEQFPSNVYVWRRVAERTGAIIKTVMKQGDDWTTPLLEAITDEAAVVTVPQCHWTNGATIDLKKVGAACRAVNAALVVDATQSLGAAPFSVEEIQPDFLAATAHKWLLGPYSYGFLYVAPRWREGMPLEENWLNRAGSEDFSRLVDYTDTYRSGARRFDVGECSNFILTPIALEALRQILDWGVPNIAETLGAMTSAIADRAKALGLEAPDKSSRAPHMIGLRFPREKAEELANRLRSERVYVSVRGASIRVSPHLYNNGEDIDRFFHALETVL